MVRWIGPFGTLVVAGPGATVGVDAAGAVFWPPLPPQAVIPRVSTHASAPAPHNRGADPLAVICVAVSIAASTASRGYRQHQNAIAFRVSRVADLSQRTSPTDGRQFPGSRQAAAIPWQPTGGRNS